MNAVFWNIVYFWSPLPAILFDSLSTETSSQVRSQDKEMLSRQSVAMNKKTICYVIFNGKRVAKLVSDGELDDNEHHPETFYLA